MNQYLSDKKLLIEFMKKIYTEEILMFDEDGNDWSEEYEIFDALERYIVENPKVFLVDDIEQLLAMFDDKCFSEHLMDELANIVSNVVIYYRNDGIHQYFASIDDVHENGKFYGKYMMVRNLMFKDFPLFERALLKEDKKTREKVKNIVEAITVPDLLEKRSILLEKLG